MQLLIVDDSQSHRISLAGLLELCDIGSHEACNGIEALQRISEHSYDAILLDWVMPELDGFHTLQHLRQMPLYRHLPVVVITACESEGVHKLALNAGADAFITKPVDFDRLMETLDEVLVKDRYVA